MNPNYLGFAVILTVGCAFLAIKLADWFDSMESEENELLRLQIGEDRPRVVGMPQGDFKPDQVQDDDPYMRAMVSATMNSNGMVFGEIDADGVLRVTESKPSDLSREDREYLASVEHLRTSQRDRRSRRHG